MTAITTANGFNHGDAHKSSICIIGAGSVGASAAYCLMQQGVSADIVLVDISKEMVQGQTKDLEDSQFLSPTSIRNGTMKEAGQCDIVVITAGARQKPDESRADLVKRNAVIMTSIVNNMKPLNDDTIIIVVSNPCDVLTYVAWKASGLPMEQVFGSGTFLDSMRLRTALSHDLGINELSINALVLGEHGDNQFVAWSEATVGCTKLLGNGFGKVDDEKYRKKCEFDTMRKAYEIIKLKGATYFGIGSCVSSLCKTILFDEMVICPISVYNEEKKAVVSWPCVIGRNGVEKILPMELNSEEQKKLDHAVVEIQKGMQACQ